MDIPKAAQAHTPEGAEEFVKFYIEELNSAWTKPQTGRISVLSDPECQACASLEATAVDLVAKGHRYAAPPLEVVSADAFGGAPTGKQFVRLELRQPGVRVLDRDGATVETDKKKQQARTALAEWKRSSWRMYELGL